MFHVDKFILHVQENSAIWLVGSNEYNDRALKDLSWNNIGNHMCDKWNKMTDTERRDQGKIWI